MYISSQNRMIELEETMRKRYIVTLTDDERAQLHELVHKGMRAARVLTRAHILLQADAGATDQAIADSLHTGRATVERVRKRFVEGNLACALTEAKRPGGKTKLDGPAEATLVAWACTTPPDERTHWTMQLLADKLVELKLVAAISDETVRRTLKKTT
jgi:transposase